MLNLNKPNLYLLSATDERSRLITARVAASFGLKIVTEFGNDNRRRQNEAITAYALQEARTQGNSVNYLKAKRSAAEYAARETANGAAILRLQPAEDNANPAQSIEDARWAIQDIMSRQAVQDVTAQEQVVRGE